MILNKFSMVSLTRLRSLAFQLLALSLFSCNKTANINANKSYLSFTHVAYGAGSVTVELDSNSLFASPLSFGETTGDTLGHLYDTLTTGVQYLSVFQGSAKLFNGFFPFQLGVHYSMFLYDTLNPATVKLIFFQDDPGIRTDTFTYVRYINFSPGTYLGIKLVNTRTDTALIPFYYADTINFAFSDFVGYNISPTSPAYQFITVHVGNYNVFAFADSVNPNPDSSNFKNLGPLQLENSVNYNVFLQGFANLDTGINKFQLMHNRLN